MKILNNLSYVIMGLVLAVIAYMGFLQIDTLFYKPISNIFSASVIVPDFKKGENPEVQYNRTINMDFLGDFSVEVKKVEDGQTICSGEGQGIHYAQNEVPQADTSFDWYVGKTCSTSPLLSPGQYYLETTYIIHSEGHPDRFLTTRSNVFTVT